MMTILASEYADLLARRPREQARTKTNPARTWDIPPSSPLATDPEVIAFFSERIGTDVLDLLKACRHRFGASRTPSRTAVYYLWKRLRGQDRHQASSPARGAK
ncbi:hypothetical protein [Xanthobacter sediminis]|uniref:hypothetical protein n=1 Tax=Xanthobacter sediminis TaxID=3119926 RepID=UPI00372C642C